MQFILFLALLLTACISEPEDRVHVIDCGTLGGADTLVVQDGKCVPK